MTSRVSRHCFLFILQLLVAHSSAVAGTYKGFDEVRDDKCVVLHDQDVQALPQTWQKYKGFIKRCDLKKGEGAKSNMSLISIWSHDYLDAQHKQAWEQFPLPILVDGQGRQCGSLPELYPTSYVNSLYVSYGKWKSGVPTEIRVDVADPTVTGDYYYPPLLWDDKDKQYKMKSPTPVTGKRRR